MGPNLASIYILINQPEGGSWRGSLTISFFQEPFFLGDNSGSVGAAKTPPEEMNCVQHVIFISIKQH